MAPFLYWHSSGIYFFTTASFFGATSFLRAFRRSAHRRFIASAIRLRPSGLRLRLRGAGFDIFTTADFAAFVLPLGRPRLGFRAAKFSSKPINAARAC